MSISTPQGGGSRRPTVSKAVAGGKPGTGKPSGGGRSPGSPGGGKSPGSSGGGKSPGNGKPPGGRSGGGGSPGGGRAGGAGRSPGGAGASGRGKSGGGGRSPVRPIKIKQGPGWGPIILFSTVGLIIVGIIGFGVYVLTKPHPSWQQKADAIPGIVNYRKIDPASLTYQQHQYGPIKYKYSPPVGGTHNPNWMQCMGNVYDAPIASEHAVHSEEHGAVWITYRPDLPKDQVAKLAAKVRGNDFMLMSPYPGLDKPISLQTWGYQLKVDNASDPRIDQFITDLRKNATMEPGAVCSSGNYINATGTTPSDLGSAAPNGSGAPVPGMTP